MSFFSRLALLTFAFAASSCLTARARAAESTPGGTLTIQTSTTAVPLGKATLTVGKLERRQGAFAGNYDIKVNPLSFANEKGELSVAFSDEDLRKLARKSTVSFHGQATESGGKHRTVDGQAMPAAADHGEITFQIVSERGKVVFHTTYRLGGK